MMHRFPSGLGLVTVAVLAALVAMGPVQAQSPPPPPFFLPADLNQDGEVNDEDLRLFADLWADHLAQGTYNAQADLNGDDVVNYYDAFLMLEYYLNPHGVTSSLGTVVATMQAPGGADDYEVLLDGARVEWQQAADGTLVVPKVPAGDHTLTVVSQSDRLTGAHERVTVRGGERVELPMPVMPTRGGRIVGRVLDGNTRVPIAGAHIVAVPLDTGPPPPPPLDVEPQRAGRLPPPEPPPPPTLGPPLLETVTDRQGRYSLDAVPRGYYDLAVNALGHEPQYRPVHVAVGEVARVDFELRPLPEPPPGPGQGIVEGTVYSLAQVTPTGPVRREPVEGALVCLEPRSPIVLQPELSPDVPRIMQAGDGEAKPEIYPPPLPPDIIVPRLCTTTDAKGHWRLMAPAGMARMTVRAEGFLPYVDIVHVIEGSTVKCDVVLHSDQGPPGPPPPPPLGPPGDEPGAPGDWPPPPPPQ